MPGCQALAHNSSLLGLDADDLDLRALLLDGNSDSRDQPTPTDRHHEAAKSGHRREDLEANRTLPGGDRRIIEGMHQVEVALALFGLESLLPAGDRRQHDLGAEAADRVALG